MLECSACTADRALVQIAGRNALKVETASEFSDLLLDLEATYGHAYDFTNGGYLILSLLVPAGSGIRAMKLNFKDADGNFGGVGEVANNFPAYYGKWQTYAIDLGKALESFRLWDGDATPLNAVTHLSLNPYNARQDSGQTYYLNALELSPKSPTGLYNRALMDRPAIANQAHTFTFDDPAELNPLMAYRVFEASNQTLEKGVGGNPTNAIRMRGRDDLDNIAFLPILSAMNGGRPVDFTNVSELFFDYYLEPGGDDFDGATLYLTSDGWANMLMDDRAYENFLPGTWQTARLPLDSLNLRYVKGDSTLLRAVDEWRLNLNYREGRKNITMWLDNVGWR